MKSTKRSAWRLARLHSGGAGTESHRWRPDSGVSASPIEGGWHQAAGNEGVGPRESSGRRGRRQLPKRGQRPPGRRVAASRWASFGKVYSWWWWWSWAKKPGKAAAAEPVAKAGGGPNWTLRHTVVTAGKKLVASTESRCLSSRLVNELPQWLCICAVRR